MPPPFRFLRANRLPECPAWLDCTFDDCYALNYAHSGSLWWGMNNQTLQKLTGPIVWWTWPGPRFTYGCKNTPPWDHFYVTFAGPWADELVRMRGFSSIFEQPVCAIGNPEPIFSKMTQLIQALDHRDEPLAWALLLGLFLDVRDTPKKQNSREQRLQSLIAEIKAAPQRVWTEEAGMRRCAVSKPHFRRLFREVTGLPFRQFCLSARMNFAASLLRAGQSTVQEVASLCGEEDIYQFYRQFRKCHNIPPGEYQRSIRLQNSSSLIRRNAGA